MNRQPQLYRPAPTPILDFDLIETVKINGVWHRIDHPAIVPAADLPRWLN